MIGPQSYFRVYTLLNFYDSLFLLLKSLIKVLPKLFLLIGVLYYVYRHGQSSVELGLVVVFISLLCD